MSSFKILQKFEFSIRNHRHDDLKSLLSQGLCPNTLLSGESPVMNAIIFNNIDGLKILKDYGAKLNIENAKGITPLVKAVECGDLNLVQLLVSIGIDVNHINKKGEKSIDQAINAAKKHDNNDIVDYLNALIENNNLSESILNNDQQADSLGITL